MPDPFTTPEPYNLQRASCLMLDPEDDPIPEFCEERFAQAGQPIPSEDLGFAWIPAAVAAVAGGVKAIAGAKNKSPAEQAAARRKGQALHKRTMRQIRAAKRKAEGRRRPRRKRHDTGVTPASMFTGAPARVAPSIALVRSPVAAAIAPMPVAPAVVESDAPETAFVVPWYRAAGFTGMPRGVEIAAVAGLAAIVLPRVLGKKRR